MTQARPMQLGPCSVAVQHKTCPPTCPLCAVAMLKLYSNDARTRCLGALKRVEATIKAQTRGQGLRFRLKGLDVMVSSVHGCVQAVPCVPVPP